MRTNPILIYSGEEKPQGEWSPASTGGERKKHSKHKKIRQIDSSAGREERKTLEVEQRAEDVSSVKLGGDGEVEGYSS